ncbi:MAG: PAS domain S-box protein, partial [Desulfobacteraceae bacterium]|nr:PAS domain S-box protein [Desulfobacteraceae bacterium]
FSAFIITLIIFVSLLFLKSLTEPISQLINGARAIGAGDLDQAIRVTSSDELQGLAREFNKMTARLKTSMQEIVELKTFNDDIFRSVSSGIITVNRKGELTSINKSAREILSFTRRKIDNKTQENIPPSIKKTLALLMLTLGKKEKLEHQVIHFSNQQGEPVFFEINTSLLNDSTGNVIGAIADIRNITLRKRMEELMVRVDKLASLGELSAGIAHEIRNPLAGMKTSIQVLAKKLTGPSQQILIKGILSEIDRLNKIVTDLLKFSGSSPSFPG